MRRRKRSANWRGEPVRKNSEQKEGRSNKGMAKKKLKASITAARRI